LSAPASDLAERVRGVGLALGFDRVGIASAEPGSDTGFLREWIARGFAGEMEYLPKRLEERVDPRLVLPGARSVIAVGLVYDPGDPGETGPPSRTGRTGPTGRARLARYALGDDYHEVLRDRLRAFESALAALAPGPVGVRGYVDTGPVQERAFAARAGLGWIGKNTCLIDPALGSYLFLGVLVTDLALAPDAREPDHCGSCRACLDACPTQAFPEPYVLDARRCLAYTTIELRGSIPDELRAGQGEWVFGCDICQEVCPWNARTRREIPPDPLGLRTRLGPRGHWRGPALEWLLGLSEGDWRQATRRSAVRRTGYQGLLRNALVAAGNSRDPALVEAVRRHAEGPDAVLAEHARWALERLAGSWPGVGEIT